LSLIEALEKKVLQVDEDKVLYTIFRPILQELLDLDLLSEPSLNEWIQTRKVLDESDDDDSIATESSQRFIEARRKLFLEPQV
jgi:hypothetical protein